MAKLKTISIQGKEYVTVAERVRHFNETYPTGFIQTEVTYPDINSSGEDFIRVKAVVMPDVTQPLRFFTGHSEEMRGSSAINKKSAVENAETSAVGRALGLMGIGIIEGIASADEVVKATAKAPTKEFMLKPESNTAPRCATCNGPTKFSTKSNKHYCAALCWKNPPTVKEPDMSPVNLDEAPFPDEPPPGLQT